MAEISRFGAYVCASAQASLCWPQSPMPLRGRGIMPPGGVSGKWRATRVSEVRTHFRSRFAIDCCAAQAFQNEPGVPSGLTVAKANQLKSWLVRVALLRRSAEWDWRDGRFLPTSCLKLSAHCLCSVSLSMGCFTNK